MIICVTIFDTIGILTTIEKSINNLITYPVWASQSTKDFRSNLDLFLGIYCFQLNLSFHDSNGSSLDISRSGIKSFLKREENNQELVLLLQFWNNFW